MTTNAITQLQTGLVINDDMSKDTISRINIFNAWLVSSTNTVLNPRLNQYRDYLLNDYQGRGTSGLTPASTQAHLSTIRAQYQKLLIDNDFREYLYSFAPDNLRLADKKAFADEIVERMRNMIHPKNAPVTIVTVQDVADSQHVRLTATQAQQLLRLPRIDTLAGLRDTALIALMLCTGIRESETANLEVDDLRQEVDGELSLQIRQGKGAKQRLVPYGSLDWCLVYVDKWLENAGISTGKVFRGFYKGNKKVRSTGLTTRSILRILDKYPVMIQGEQQIVKPHDLRRTYAKILHDSGMRLLYISQNLGHASIETTKTYIGDQDFTNRKPAAMIEPPHKLKLVGLL